MNLELKFHVINFSAWLPRKKLCFWVDKTFFLFITFQFNLVIAVIKSCLKVFTLTFNLQKSLIVKCSTKRRKRQSIDYLKFMFQIFL